MESKNQLAALTAPDITFGVATVGRHRIHYARAGRGAPVIMLHGATVGWANWHTTIGPLAERFTVYALDLPGSGESSPLDYARCNLETDFVTVVEQFIREHCPGTPHLVGHSFGAWIALKIASRRRVPIGKLVLVSPVGLSREIPFAHRLLAIRPFVFLLTKTAVRPTRSNLKKFLLSVLRAPVELPDAFVDYFHACVRQGSASHPLWFMHRLSGLTTIRRELIITSVRDITAPTLVVLGAEDPLVRHRAIEPMLRDFPNAEVHVLERTGHVPPLEARDVFDRLLIDFLARE